MISHRDTEATEIVKPFVRAMTLIDLRVLCVFVAKRVSGFELVGSA